MEITTLLNSLAIVIITVSHIRQNRVMKKLMNTIGAMFSGRIERNGSK